MATYFEQMFNLQNIYIKKYKDVSKVTDENKET